MGTTLTTFARRLRRLFKSEDGPTAVEYALLIALITLIAASSIQSIGKNMNKTFKNAAKKMGS